MKWLCCLIWPQKIFASDWSCNDTCCAIDPIMTNLFSIYIVSDLPCWRFRRLSNFLGIRVQLQFLFHWHCIWSADAPNRSMHLFFMVMPSDTGKNKNTKSNFKLFQFFIVLNGYITEIIIKLGRYITATLRKNHWQRYFYLL